MAIAAGDSHTVALKRDGTVVAWGDNRHGQTNVACGLTDMADITAGRSYTVALNGDGTVVAWGDNEHGQTTIPSNLVGVVAIAAGKNHTVALVIPQSYPESNRLLTVDEVKSMIEEAAASAATIPLKLDVKTAKKKIIIEQEAELKRLRQAEELLEEARHFEALETRKSFWSTKNYIAARELYQKAANLGNKEAQEKLRTLPK